MRCHRLPNHHAGRNVLRRRHGACHCAPKVRRTCLATKDSRTVMGKEKGPKLPSNDVTSAMQGERAALGHFWASAMHVCVFRWLIRRFIGAASSLVLSSYRQRLGRLGAAPQGRLVAPALHF